MTAKLLSLGNFPLLTLRPWGNDERYCWTTRVGLAGLGFLALLAAFVANTRIFDMVIAGVQPEALALTTTMTAPFTVGAVSLFILAAALMETLLRCRLSGSESASTPSTA